MATTKRMNESAFAKLVKEVNSVGELIRTHQNEKQAVIDEYEKERTRFKTGKISEKALASSAKKCNLEVSKLDKKIKEAIAKVGKLSEQIKKAAKVQVPKVIRVKVSGVSTRRKAVKKVKKKAPAKKKR